MNQEFYKQELQNMCIGEHKKTGAFYEKDSSGSLQPKQRVLEIGHILNSVGGFNMMSDVGLTITGTNQRELDMAWNRIGTWMS